MPNTIITSGIISKSYVSRGLITHNFDNKALVRSTDGKFWAVFSENYSATTLATGSSVGPLGLYYSADDGFTWTRVWNGSLLSGVIRVAGLNTNGPHINMALFEHINRIAIWHSYGATQHDVKLFLFDITNPLTPIEGDETIVIDSDGFAVDVPYNQKTMFVSYVSITNFKVKAFYAGSNTSFATVTHTGSYYNLFSGVAHQDGYVDYAIMADTGTGANKIVHFRYTESSGTFTTDHNISVFAGAYDATDISIARDGAGTLLVAWGRNSPDGADMDVYYSISGDDGITWSIATIINKSAGHSVYIDAISGEKVTRTTVLGGLSGFMIGYTRSNTDNVPKTYVRTISTAGVLGAEKEIGIRVARAVDSVVGLRFFRPSGCSLLDLTDPGLVRIGFQVGEGNSSLLNDTKPVRFCQELLRASAYPLISAEDNGEYTIDLPGDNQLQVTVSILGGTSENIDYYAEGLTGPLTDRHIAAFTKIGTTARLFKYEPTDNSEMDDRSAYSAPTSYSTLMVLDPNTYEAPLANSSEQFNTFIERDIRKLYLPPDFHLNRTYIINVGNFLKRTVWTIYFDGNEYELSQVVPYFIKSQIAYYSANAYVIGPSNNPFAKNTLPSET